MSQSPKAPHPTPSSPPSSSEVPRSNIPPAPGKQAGAAQPGQPEPDCYPPAKAREQDDEGELTSHSDDVE